MSSTWKNNIEITIFGESHGKAIGIVLGNLPSGIKIDLEEVAKEMKRRAPGQDKMSTARKEADKVEIMSGLQDDVTTGAPLCGIIYNCDQHSKDYSLLKEKMRPGHSDYPAFIKYRGFNDVRGGGHFSGRITAPVVFAGAIAKQILAKQGIQIGAHILSIKNEYDENFDMRLSTKTLEYLRRQHYPVINQEKYENKISELFGSEANDCYYYQDALVKTTSNNNGGITGGISNGMPVVFTVGIKPTPSISKEQKTIDVKKHENTTLGVHGRHDPCIVFRATVVVEAMAALAMLDLVR